MVIVDPSVWNDYLNRVKTPAAAWLDRELPRRGITVRKAIVKIEI